MIDFSFKNWLNLRQEMTSCASVAGGSYSNDIASFSRPIFAEPFRRKFPTILSVDDLEKHRKKKHKKKH